MYFLEFSHSGWTRDAQRYQIEIQRNQPSFGNVHVVEMCLLDLAQVDHDLEQWPQPVEPEGDIPF